MARTRTTKKLAQRIDLNYFKRPTPFKRAKLGLAILLPLFALLWIGWHFAAHDARVFSSGRLSEPHAVIEKECAACHVQQAGTFSASVQNNACLSCHDGPIHHAEQRKSPPCAECHVEHQGRMSLSAASNQSCAACHSDLGSSGGAAHFASSIRSFSDGHPQFSSLKAGTQDPGTIKLNHSLHMKPIRRAPNGPNVQLACSDCHRPAAVSTKTPWSYADAKYTSASVSYTDDQNFRPIPSAGLASHNPSSGRELMAPVRFSTACASCHLLTFDKRFDEGVPHDRLDVVHAFLLKKFSDYIAAHPSELHEMQDPARELTGKPLAPSTRTLSASQWVQEKVTVAEELLWNKTCSQCHAIRRGPLASTDIARWSPGTVHWTQGTERTATTLAPPGTEPPQIAPSLTTLRWLPHSKFNHEAHTGFACASCHAAALTSEKSADVLIPGIATCQTCHAPGPDHAESRCFECHTYHDWSQRKEVTPQFTLPGLLSGK